MVNNVINRPPPTAVNVKHFGHWEELKDININGTINVIKVANKTNCWLHYISTISVSGELLVKQVKKPAVFNEENLFIGQFYSDNVYVHSKYIAEKEVIKAFTMIYPIVQIAG